MRRAMKVRLAAWMAPRPVPARTATIQKCHFVSTKYASTVTAVHWMSMTKTTNFGPRVSVGFAHAADPARAVTWITMNSAMISVMAKPSVFAANTPANAMTVLTPSSKTRYARRNRRIAVRSGCVTISRNVARGAYNTRETASRSGMGGCEAAGQMTKAGTGNKTDRRGGWREEPQPGRL